MLKLTNEIATHLQAKVIEIDVALIGISKEEVTPKNTKADMKKKVDTFKEMRKLYIKTLTQGELK